ncbi:MAG: L-aspartate oxidase [Clostridia bacterium]|nr:L-aspartate oxidase [Clostridia bacterium]
MKRYIADISDAQIHQIDVAIIGSGLAGMYAAYHLDDSLNCALFTKEQIEDSSSSLAQGGIAVVTEKDDTFLYHFQDTMNAGAGECDEMAVRTIVEEGPEQIEELLAIGAHFDIDRHGNLLTTREGGHGMNRILHAGGDATGQEMVRALKKTVLAKDNIKVHENSFVADILTQDDEVAGLSVYENDAWHVYKTRHVIVATGGIGQVFRYTTNPGVATGDGIALGFRAGAVIENMEFIQFHPTGMYTPENRNTQCFLISEAVRGEGGILLNDANQRFMKERHPLAELAPRDIVARENYREIQNQASPYVKLDITAKSRDFLSKRFPTIFGKCMENGIDMSKDFIPVGPVQHYMMGGITTDLMGQTNIKGLLACGEAAMTGVHGANRLASNSTLECLVFGRKCADVVNDEFTGADIEIDIPKPAQNENVSFDTEEMMVEIKGIMVKYCGILRNGPSMMYGLHQVEQMLAVLDNAKLNSLRDMELYNMATIANEVLKGAIARKRSVGAHYRIDEGRTY